MNMNKSKKKVNGGTLCAIPCCKNTKKVQPDVEYHLFPRDDSIRNAWLSKCTGMFKFNPASSRICSNHFSSNDYVRDLRNELLGLPTRKILKPTSIPTLMLTRDVIPRKSSGSTRAMIRKQKLKKKEIMKTVLKSTPSPIDSQFGDFSNVKISPVFNELLPQVQKNAIDWKEKYKQLQDKYAKLEQAVVFWKSKSKKLEQNVKPKKKAVPKRKVGAEKKTTCQLQLEE